MVLVVVCTVFANAADAGDSALEMIDWDFGESSDPTVCVLTQACNLSSAQEAGEFCDAGPELRAWLAPLE